MPMNSKKRNAKGAARPNAGSGQVESIQVDSASVPTSSAGKHETRNEVEQPSWFARINLWIVAAMLLHVLIAGHAASTKSATFDESVHALGGMLQWRWSDYRLDPETPSLWKHLAALATIGLPLEVNFQQPDSRAMLENMNAQERWAIKVLFQTEENDGVALIDRARMIMPIFGAGVVLLVGLWAQHLAGKLAGAVSAFWAAVDPNLLAHSGLVTSDVACTASLLACFYYCWRMCQRASLSRVAMFSAACGIAACIKFTSLALPVFLLPMALMRIIQPSPWQVVGGHLVSKTSGRLAMVGLGIALAGGTAWLAIWSSYGFRYLPTADSNLSFNTQFPINIYAHNQWLNQQMKSGQPLGKPPESGVVELNRVQEFCLLAQKYQLLPQAYLQGLAYQQAMSNASPSFIDGQHQAGGSMLFFPKAWAYKSPLTTIVAVLLSLVYLTWNAYRRRRTMALELAYLFLPFAALIVMSLIYSLNIGLRHLLPAFPLMWIGLGVAIATAFRKQLTARVVVGLLVMVALESLASHPNYIAYFNFASRGNNQGLDRLSDSNLDWGQDIRLLDRWQEDHRDVPLYLSYFGSADPAAYVVDYQNISPGYFYATTTATPDINSRGFLAYSATWLQGTYVPSGPLRDQMDMIRQHARPTEVLGGTIYLYSLPIQWREGPK
ncbi:MAG TPA: hypothetical protein DCF63_15090 [Planctomycetaceae bacterium]|nr:hypothetical protein [Planctomycetaceae bacterium]